MLKNANKSKRGRPSKGGKPRTLKLTDEVVDFYRKRGGGALTLGIERVAWRGIKREMDYVSKHKVEMA